MCKYKAKARREVAEFYAPFILQARKDKKDALRLGIDFEEKADLARKSKKEDIAQIFEERAIESFDRAAQYEITEHAYIFALQQTMDRIQSMTFTCEEESVESFSPMV